METLTTMCTGCGAPLNYSENEKILVCAYCGNQFLNPHYNEETTACLDMETVLKDMCRVCRVAGHSFSYGRPLMAGKHHDAARKYFGIPDDTRIYMVYDATYACNCKDGIAFTNEGIYYHESKQGYGLLTWEDVAAAELKPTGKGLYIDSLFFPSTRVTADELNDVLMDLKKQMGVDPAKKKEREKWTGTMEELVAHECGAFKYDGSDISCSGTPLTSGKHAKAARKHFNIPDSDNIYLVYDSTLFGSCKKGFALTSSGLYINDDAEVILHWDAFKNAKIVSDNCLYINDLHFATNGRTGNELCTLLEEIQEQM